MAGQGGRARRSPTPSGSRIPPFPSWNRIRGGGKEERERGGRGAGPLSLSYSDQGGRGARPISGHLSSLPLRPIYLPGGGVPVTSRYSGKIPISPGTLPISKYRLPIYQYLCLDHFETPRHVRDHIQDSEPLRYIKTHKLII